jgi:CheY-like chemotaxis protein
MPRILLIDDDEALRYATVKLLAGAGYEVEQARDFQEALRIIEDGKPLELLVTDAVLPGVNGFALARMARMKHHDIKCIYISGFDVPAHEAFGPILRKPFTDGQLLAEVARALARGSEGHATT